MQCGIGLAERLSEDPIMIKAMTAATAMSLMMFSAAGASPVSSATGLNATAASEVLQVKAGGRGHARAGGRGGRGYARRGGGRGGRGYGGYGYGGGWGPGVCMWVGPVWVCP
jgi:hypothetical protein